MKDQNKMKDQRIDDLMELRQRIAELEKMETERREVEKSLKESEERYRELFHEAPVGYHEYDQEGRITNVNRTDLEMLGYSRKEMIGQFVWKFHVEEEVAHQQILAKLSGAFPPGRNLERTYRRKDGTTFPALFEDRLIRDEKGQIKGIRCAIQDFTERKQMEEALEKGRHELEERVTERTSQLAQKIEVHKKAEEALQESEKRYYDLFENANDIIYTHDLAGNFTSINRAAERVSGYTKEEALELNINQIVAPEYLKPILEALGPESLGKGPLIHELEIITKEGRRVPLELSTRLIFRGQKPIGVEGIARDITERKKLEEERETLIKELQEALAKVKTLSGFIPICASCKKIRDDKGYWNQIETYIRDHSEAEFSHSICPDCMEKLYPDFAKDKK
jgi:two-component system NtrC family sensor kinase